MLINRIPNWLFFAPDGDGSGGDGGDGDNAKERGFQKELKDFNDNALDLALSLWEDNHNYRRRNRELTQQLQEVKEQVPAEGAVVLTGDQAQAWAAYQAIGTPEQVRAQIEEKSQLQGKLDSLQREAVLRDVATTAGFRFPVLQNADALAKLGGKELTYEVREVDVNGEKVKTAFVKDGDTDQPLVEYAQEQWADLLPSLVVQQDSGAGRNQGTFFPSQHQGSGGGNKPQTARQTAEATLSKQYASRASNTN